MSNDIELRVTGSDTSAPAVTSATRNAASLRDMVTKTGTSMRTAAGHARRLADELTGVSASALSASHSLARLDTELAAAGRGTASLDNRVDDLKDSLNDLARADVKLDLVDADRERGELRKVTDTADLVPEARQQAGRLGSIFGRVLGDEAGNQAATGLTTRLAAMGGSISPVGAAVAAPLALSIAAVLGAAVGSAITGGVGVGGVVGGLTVAAKHSAVKSAATSLGDEFQSRMQRAAVAYVPAAIKGVDIIRGHLRESEGDLTRVFSSTAQHVPKLADAAGRSVREVLSGVADLAEVSEPAVDSIADGLVRIGRAAGDGLSSLTDNAESGARALTLVFTVVEMGAQSVFRVINALAEMYEVMEVGNGLIELLSAKTSEGETANVDFAQSVQEVIAGFRQEADAAEIAQRAMQQYAEAADRIIDQNLDVAEATLQYRDALNAAKDAADGKKKVTADEEESLLRLARSSNSLTDSLEQQGASAATLAQRQKDARAEFIAAATAMGYSKTRAAELADQYLKIPREVVTQIDADTDQAARNLRSIRDLIAQIRSKRVVITAVGVRSEGRNVPIGDGIGGRAHGGITGAASGGIRGNLTWVGEQGPELIDLPPGTMVHPSGTSQRMAAAGGGLTINVPIQAGYIATPQQLEDILTRTLDDLFRQGRLSQLAGVS